MIRVRLTDQSQSVNFAKFAIYLIPISFWSMYSASQDQNTPKEMTRNWDYSNFAFYHPHSSFPNCNWTKTERQMDSPLTDPSRGTGVVERNRKRKKKEHGRTVEKFRSCQEITSHRPLSRPVFWFQLSSHRLYYLGDAQSRAVVSRNGDQTTRSWIGDVFFYNISQSG